MKSTILLLQQPWLLTPEAHSAMVAASRQFFDSPPQKEPEPRSPLFCIEDGVGVVSIEGPIIRRPGLVARMLFGATDTDEIIEAVHEAASSPSAQAVLLDIDSPGGSVSGTPELAQAVADLAKRKYVYAFTSGEMCSAAYWVASQADAIYMTPGARVGSIGVILSLLDATEALQKEGLRVEVFAAGKFKSIGLQGVPLSDDQRTLIANNVEEIAADFRQAVLSRGRKIPEEAMEGQTFSAKSAMRMNLAGTVKSRAEALEMLRRRHVAS